MTDYSLAEPPTVTPYLFVQDAFTYQAVRTPTAPALCFEGHILSYAQVERLTNQVAHALIQAGVGKEQRVGILFDRSPQMIIALLGVLKAGAAYVPFDPHQPTARLHALLDDATLSLLLTQPSLTAILPVQSIPVLLLDHEYTRFTQYPTTPPTLDTDPDDLAYMIYTSGSTGQPKGVLITHRGIMNLVTCQIAAFNLSSASRVLQFAPLNFDASVSEIWTTLLAGACLYIVHTGDVLPGADLRRVLVDNAITVVTLPPSVLALLEPHDFPALETVISAGEACSVELVTRWGTNRTFINAYGPTEITVCATMAVDVAQHSHISIGRPLAHTTIYLVDDAMELIEQTDVIGEMVIRSPGVARGYHNQPERTAERFFIDPFDRSAPAMVYRTGDHARWLPDGSLEFVGRRDNQLKLRGFRIEPGEIESTLGLYPHVRQAVVTTHPDAHGNDRLVAYVLGDDHKELTISGLRAYSKATLPNYMVPSAFVLVSRFALTSSGKVDLTALPAPDFSNLQRDTPFVQPQTDLEQTIAAIWEEVLGVQMLGINDNFFDVGGHSLLATRVISLIRQRLDIEIPLSTLLSVEPTIAATAQIIENHLLHQADPDELSALLAELEAMSDEDVQRFLERAQGATE